MGTCVVTQGELRERVRDSHHMPSYLPIEPVVDEHIRQLVGQSWQLAMSMKSPGFLLARQKCQQYGGEVCNSPLVMFYDTFYHRLFTVAPEVKVMFSHKIQMQGRMLAKMFSVIVHHVETGELEELKRTMEEVATSHNPRGVLPYHYSICGEVLFYSLQVMLQEEYTEEIHSAWLHVYGLMMQIIIPRVVAYHMGDAANNSKNNKKSASTSSGEVKYLPRPQTTKQICPIDAIQVTTPPHVLVPSTLARPPPSHSSVKKQTSMSSSYSGGGFQPSLPYQLSNSSSRESSMGNFDHEQNVNLDETIIHRPKPAWD